MVTGMHPIEAKIIEFVKSGRNWQIDDLGGISKLASVARVLGKTPMMPELLQPLVLAWTNAKIVDKKDYEEVLHNLLEVATIDITLLEAVDILDQNRPLPGDGDERCFMVFLQKAADNDDSLSGLARGAALDGAGVIRNWLMFCISLLNSKRFAPKPHLSLGWPLLQVLWIERMTMWPLPVSARLETGLMSPTSYRNTVLKPVFTLMASIYFWVFTVAPMAHRWRQQAIAFSSTHLSCMLGLAAQALPG